MAMLDKVGREKAEVVWALDSEHPQLWREVIAHYPWLQDVAAWLREGCPVAPGLEPFDLEHCVRPPRHMRAFYLKQPGGAVLAVKGSEVADGELERAFRQSYSLGQRWAPLEVFPLLEQKLGLAVHMAEALDEAALTARFQEKYLHQFKTLGAAPIHLAVYRFPDEIAERYLAIIDTLGSDRSKQQSRLLAQDGLAAHVYFYPHLPIRLAHIVPQQLSGDGIVDAPSRDAVLASNHGYDAQTATETFFSLAGRMLALGFFPLSMASCGIGYCTSAQNVTFKGGMVDMESLHPFEKVKNDWEFATTFLTTMASLCATAKVLLHSPLPNVRFEFSDPSTVSMLLADFVWDRIRREVSACAASGVTIDARLQEMLDPPSLHKITELAARMHPKREDFFLAAHVTSGHDNRGWDSAGATDPFRRN
jgi:hypothetical protein